jgi:hypothetical protein
VLRDPVLPEPLHRLGISGLTFPEGELSFEIRRVSTGRGQPPRFIAEGIRATDRLNCVVVRST